MLPAGKIDRGRRSPSWRACCSAGDIVIDGGNTFYKDDIRRAEMLSERGIHYVDVGTSGGIWGLERGYCMMIGGDKEVVDRLDPIFAALAPGAGDVPRTPGRDGRDPRAEHGYIHAGPSGAGHFVKMVHNGIEYGLMQAYAEGFDILQERQQRRRCRRTSASISISPTSPKSGGAAASISLVAARSDRERAGRGPEARELFAGLVEDSGEGRWTDRWRRSKKPCRPTCCRRRSTPASARADEHTFAEKLLSAMRKGFGGHVEAGSGQPMTRPPGQRA